MSGSGISWGICKSASRSRQITMPAPHHSSFLQAGCPSCRPTNSVKALKAHHITSHSHITFDVNMFTFTMQEHTHSCLMALCPGLPGLAGTRKEASLDFTEARDSEWQWHQWAICKSAPCSRQIAMPAPHHSVYYRPDALPATQPTVSKHCRNCEHIFTPMKLEGNWGQK